MLESLEFERLQIQQEPATDELFNTKVSNILLAGRLQSLCLIKVRVEAQERSMEKFNKLMKFILRGCKNLKRFIVDCVYIRAPGDVNMYFRRNQQLNHVSLYMPNCRYYTFHHQFGRYWKNISEEVNGHDDITNQQQRQPYVVNLAWDTTKDITFDLSSCL